MFNNLCPGCGFELDSLVGCLVSRVPEASILYTHPSCSFSDSLFQISKPFKAALTRSSSLPRDAKPDLTTGIRQFDQALVLKLGHLVVLQGKPAHNISMMLCARAISPLGMNSDVVFVDGGNLFSTHALSQHSRHLRLDSERARERIHLSRAFTHHQLAQLTGERLSLAMKEHFAKVAVVSDITQLYCDPDVRDREEALDMFAKSLRYLASLAEQNNALVIVSNTESRNQKMEKILASTAHVFARLEDKGETTKLTITKHPFTLPKKPVTYDPQHVSTSLDEHVRME